jgi:2-dehydropantoate 2-reductase
MRIAVMGAGGIGSYLGGWLANHGADVTLVCRGNHLAAVREQGLQVRSPKRNFTVAGIAASASPAEVGPVDAVIVAVKLYDLADATRAMVPMLAPRTLVLTIQNGVTAADEAAAVVGVERVVPGTLFINAHVEAPGLVVSRSQSTRVIMGERLAPLQKLMVEAGMDAKVSADMPAELWRKFIPVAALSALSCLCRQPIGPILEFAPLKALYSQGMHEVAALGLAKGVRLEPDIVERMLAVAATYKYDARVSMLEDLEAGKRLELEWLSGYVSREAAKVGVPAPFHDMAYASLKLLAK